MTKLHDVKKLELPRPEDIGGANGCTNDGRGPPSDALVGMVRVRGRTGCAWLEAE
jgi:hypothetical protein